MTAGRALALAPALALAACHGAAARPPAPGAGCPRAPVRIVAQRELDGLRGCTTLAGLSLRGAVPFDLAPLADLARVEGDLAVRATFALGSLRLPSLTHVGGTLAIVGNLSLSGVYLPALSSAGAVVVSDGVALVELMLPALAKLDGDLALTRLPALELVDVGSLPTDARVTVEAAPRVGTWNGAGAPATPQSQP